MYITREAFVERTLIISSANQKIKKKKKKEQKNPKNPKFGCFCIYKTAMGWGHQTHRRSNYDREINKINLKLINK